MPSRAPHPRTGSALCALLHLAERQCKFQMHGCKESVLSWNGWVKANIGSTEVSEQDTEFLPDAGGTVLQPTSSSDLSVVER